MPREGVDRAQYRLAKFGSAERSRQLDERITETAATVGLEFHLDKLTRTPNTLDAHRLIRFAGQRGVQDGVVEALFEGYFCNGADIGDDEVLAELGVEGGLDREDIAADAGERRRPQGSAPRADRMARNAGIQGVPSFALQGPRAVLRRRAGRRDGRRPSAAPGRSSKNRARLPGLRRAAPSSSVGDDHRPLHR